MFLARHYSLPLLAKRVTAVSPQRKHSWYDDKGWISAGPRVGGWHLRTAGFTMQANPKKEPQVLAFEEGWRKKEGNLPCYGIMRTTP